MKVVYTKPILEQIRVVYAEAKCSQKIIERIELTREEAEQLVDSVRPSCSYWMPTPSLLPGQAGSARVFGITCTWPAK